MGIAGISIWQILILLVLLVIIIPTIHVAISERSHGLAKAAWLVSVFLFSLLAYIPYLIVTGKVEKI